jgi:hypothetical protein
VLLRISGEGKRALAAERSTMPSDVAPRRLEQAARTHVHREDARIQPLLHLSMLTLFSNTSKGAAIERSPQGSTLPRALQTSISAQPLSLCTE